jgi:predicted ribosome quality control (RQC) complex YloA/Tae2 family protein
VLRFNGVDDALIISCDRNFNTLYLRPNFARARSNSVDVLAGCSNQCVVAIHIHPMDRVVMFRLESGERIDARFFGAKANVVVVDGKEIVGDAFKDAKAIVGTKAEYRVGEMLYDVDGLRETLSSTQPSLSVAMKEAFPGLGSTLVKEVLHRAEISSAQRPAGVHDEHVQALRSGLMSVLNDLASPRARVYVDEEGSPKTFSIIPLRQFSNLREKPFLDVHEAIRFFVSRTRSREFVDAEKRSVLGRLQQKLSKARRTIEAVENDLKNNSRAEEYQRFRELLMSNAHLAKRGDKEILISNEAIPLQKELSPVQNAQRYFDKAKHSRIAQQQATERLKDLRASIAPAEKLLSLLDEVNSKEELKKFMSEYKSELEEFGIGEKSEQREQLPFRIFTVDGGFEVWAGKSSKNNDELTLKHAKPNDLWFHARGASGSHVVLKTNTGKGEPSKRAKEQAASIAAYYSKMKNAKMVPVAMTEKKYVRKPKGAAPGSVMVEREKVIFAEPMLPNEKLNGHPFLEIPPPKNKE